IAKSIRLGTSSPQVVPLYSQHQHRSITIWPEGSISIGSTDTTTAELREMRTLRKVAYTMAKRLPFLFHPRATECEWKSQSETDPEPKRLQTRQRATPIHARAANLMAVT